jgi:2-polyprenyl-3-methyl-5-hydroxy-6-metoxy-1,4-benzoquinol methylase
MVDIFECPICKSRDLQKFTQCKDYTVSHETFQIDLCQKCALGITTPRPDTNRLSEYYQSEEYISHSGKSSGGIGFLYKLARSFSLNWKKKLIQKHNPIGSILDFGCGTGEFLNTMHETGWEVTGVEPSDSARLKSEILIKQKTYNSLEAINEKKFDVITAWHVVEHVPDLTETFLNLKSLLKKDGTIFIAVPNYQSPDAALYKEHWAGYDVPRHLWHFSKKSMGVMMNSMGLKLIDTIPMKLDAYYVSMLSEKYRTTNHGSITSLLKGFLFGLKSNLRAGRETNHSSLIYIAKISEV